VPEWASTAFVRALWRLDTENAEEAPVERQWTQGEPDRGGSNEREAREKGVDVVVNLAHLFAWISVIGSVGRALFAFCARPDVNSSCKTPNASANWHHASFATPFILTHDSLDIGVHMYTSIETRRARFLEATSS